LVMLRISRITFGAKLFPAAGSVMGSSRDRTLPRPESHQLMT
jgi:hypothetical protein